jgi:hypothetical protein
MVISMPQTRSSDNDRAQALIGDGSCDDEPRSSTAHPPVGGGSNVHIDSPLFPLDATTLGKADHAYANRDQAEYHRADKHEWVLRQVAHPAPGTLLGPSADAVPATLTTESSTPTDTSAARAEGGARGLGEKPPGSVPAHPVAVGSWAAVGSTVEISQWPPQHEAAKQLGVSATMLRKARDRLGAHYWDGRYNVPAILQDPDLRCPATARTAPAGLLNPRSRELHKGTTWRCDRQAGLAGPNKGVTALTRWADAGRPPGRLRCQPGFPPPGGKGPPHWSAADSRGA